MGCIAVGSDLEIRAASGARRNAAFDNATASFAAADARRLPFAPQTKFAAAAADLPYGRSASRRASLGPDLYVAALTELRPILVTGGRAALMALAQDLPERCPDGWELEWSCVEHARSVDRSIAVWRSA
jgi:tRNA G10  N-methylase Trm11